MTICCVLTRLLRLQLSKRMGVRLEARRKREAEEARISAMKRAEAERWEAIQVRSRKSQFSKSPKTLKS